MPFPILPSNSASGYFLTKSLRFRGSASAQLTRTFPSAGNKKTWTWSAWVKRGSLPASVIHKIFTAESPPTYDPDGYIAFGGSSYQDCLRFQSYVGGVNASFVTTQVFRDPSAWYHIIVAVDTTQATSTDRVKIYVNGSQVTAFTVATYPSQNADLAFNGAYSHILGSAGYDFDGYLAEVNFINGLQLPATSFGSFNSLTGVWQPAKYTGTYGTNGFYLPFPNNGVALSANYLVVAGGASGSSAGGGAGGLLTGTSSINSAFSYAVTVGAGGSGGNGGNSVFNALTAIGGGTQNASGGSGGGGYIGNGNFQAGGSGTSGQGNAGGNHEVGAQAGGGGGGAGASGSNTSGNTGGAGGVGVASSISGSSVYYAGGGGGYGTSGVGSGGNGGGGSGSGVAGTANTGGGGGGSANGGSGVVIVSYAGSPVFSGGTITSSGGNTIHTFTSSGTLVGLLGGIADDYSGNGNNFTPINISLTTGSTYDSMNDVPTLTNATTANYCVINPLVQGSVTGTTSNGNLKITSGSGDLNYFAMPTMFVSSGKWYAEVVMQTGSGCIIGIVPQNPPFSGNYFGNAAGCGTGMYQDGRMFNYDNAGNVQSGLTGFSTGTVVGVALDMDNGIFNMYINGTIVSTGRANNNCVTYTLSSVSPTWGISFGNDATYTTTINYGQQPFSYTPPTGYVALNTYNLPTSTIVKGNTVMDATTYSATGSTPQTITNTAGFKPDLVWTKPITSVGENAVNDSVRGASKLLITSSTSAEATDAQYLTSFNSNGYSLGTNNWSGTTVVGWQWQAGQGTTSSNTSGSITSTVSVNPTAGFSIVTYTGNGTLGATVGHGLGVAPSLVIVKTVNITSPNYGWQVYHVALGATKTIVLNSTGAALTSTGFWNDTAPTSSVFSLGNDWDVNKSSTTYIAYCWSQIAGFSSIGSYIGNLNADGPFVFTGFRPKYVLARASASASYWNIFDSVRDPYNYADKVLYANATNAQSSGGGDRIDILSNGFKVRGAGYGINSPSEKIIYIAFAENPFKNALAR